MKSKEEIYLYPTFSEIIRYIFQYIGPKSKLEEDEDIKYTFEDDIYFNRRYFMGGSVLRTCILNNITKYRGKVNESSAYVLFKYVCKSIYSRIKSRKADIDDTLNTYLQDDDISYGFTKMNRMLKNSYKNH